MQIFTPWKRTETARLPQIHGETYYDFLRFCMQHHVCMTYVDDLKTADFPTPQRVQSVNSWFIQ